MLDTDKGLVILTGCGHAGLINILTYAHQTVHPAAQVYAALGGFHLFAAKADALAWTAGKLKEFGVAQILGAHCTGIEPMYYFRDRLGLDRKACVVGAVGEQLELACRSLVQPLQVAKPEVLFAFSFEEPLSFVP